MSAELAVEYNPNLAEGWAYYGLTEGLSGRPKDGLDHIAYAFDLSPKDPLRYMWHTFRAVCYTTSIDHEHAAAAASASINLYPKWFFSHMAYAASLAMIGQLDEARQSWEQAKVLNELVSLPAYGAWLKISTLDDAHQQEIIEELAKAGCE